MYDKFGIKKAINRIDGSLAIAIYDFGKLYLYKDGNPLHILTSDTEEDDKIFYFTSKPEYLEEVFVKTKTLYDIFQKKEKRSDILEREMDNEELLTFDCETGKMDISELKSGVIEYRKEVAYSKSYKGCSYSTNRNYERDLSEWGKKKETTNTSTTSVTQYQEPGTTGGNYIDTKCMEDNKFDNFIKQLKSTTKKMDNTQKLKLFEKVCEIADPVWEDFANKYGGTTNGTSC